jgi:hypothetical protein
VDLVIVSIARGDPDVVMKVLERFGPFTSGLTVPGLPSSSSPLVNNSTGPGSGRKLFTGLKGRLILQFFDQDWGPGTKLLPSHYQVITM